MAAGALGMRDRKARTDIAAGSRGKRRTVTRTDGWLDEQPFVDRDDAVDVDEIMRDYGDVYRAQIADDHYD